MAARGARPEFSVGTVAPALDGIVIEDGTEVCLPARDRLGRASRAQIDGGRGRGVQVGGASTVSK